MGVLCACARMNGRPDPAMPKGALGKDASEADASKAPGGALQLLDPRLRYRFFPMCFVWFAASMSFYGLAMNAGTLPLSIYMANVVGGLSCLPSYIFARFLVESKYCGRRGAVAFGLLIGGMGLLLSIKGSEQSLIVLYYLATGAVSLSFAVLYVWASELFPADIRGTSMGMQSMCARIGAMISPFVAALGTKDQPGLPLLVVAASFLPETRGQPEIMSMADMGKVEVQKDVAEPQDVAETLLKKETVKTTARQRSASVGVTAKKD